MKLIYCNVNPFDKYSRLYALDENDKVQTLSKGEFATLGKLIFAECIQNQTCKVHLYGLPNFVQPIVNDIMQQELNEYGQVKIQVEVN